jgi:hypothetical protein
MRKPDAAFVMARKASLPARAPDDAVVKLVCAALMLAFLALTIRIMSIW